MAGLKLNLNNAHLHRNIGDLIIVYTWMNDERAMILIPAHRPGSPWYVVLESAAYKYDDVQYLSDQGKVAAEVLGMTPDINNWVKIATIINEGLPDLISMPPAPLPEHMSNSYGKLTLKADGQAINEEDLKLEKDQVTYG